MKSKIFTILFFIFCLVILGLTIRGISGNPTSTEISQPYWKENGPFELSPERGRFALTYTMVEEKSFYFSEPIARFVAPDVGFNNGKYVSIFAPLVSFIILPGYFLGKLFGIGQVGAFGTIALFALFNVILLRLIAIRMGADRIPATVVSLLFLFATPAFAYGVNLYQHHISTFLILLSLFVLLKTNRIWALFIVFFLCALSIPLDYPNLFLMLPIGIYALGRIVNIKNENSKISFKLNFIKLLTIFIMVIPILFFFWFNKYSYGNPLQLSGTVKTATFSNNNVSNNLTIQQRNSYVEATSDKSAVEFFDTRELLNGLYIHFLSPDRGIIVYAPIVLFGFLGMLLAIKKRVKMISVLIGIVGFNVLLYSMWGDPWGGWAFGSRYLIPSYAILSIFTGLLITYWGKKIFFVVPFLIIAFYSIAVNTLGAITTSALPPKVQVLGLEKLSGIVQKYTYERNWEMLLTGNSKSFVFQTYLSPYLSSVHFYVILTLIICSAISVMVVYYYLISMRGGKANV